MSARGHATPALAPGALSALRYYARTAPWIDRLDLDQEAYLAALEASRTPPEASTPEQRESWLVAIALARFVASQRCPVSFPDCGGERLRAVSSARGCDLTVSGDDGAEYEHPGVTQAAAESWEPLECRLDRARALTEVRRILAEQSEAARLVLLTEERSQDVAHRLGVSVVQVYRDTADAMRALRAALCPEAA